MRGDVGLDAIERVFEIFRRGRFHQIRKRSVRESVLALLFDRQHLNRDMPGCRIQLQIVEDRPAEHVRQEHVQRDRRWLIFLARLSAVCPRCATIPLNPLSRAIPSRMRA